MFFVQYPWKFHVLNPHPCLIFFWNSPFWGVLAKKPTQKQPKMTVSAGTNFKNWSTKDPISIKLAWYVYHLNTFHLYWTLPVSIKEQQRAHPKNYQKIPKIYQNLGFNPLKTIYKMLRPGIFFCIFLQQISDNVGEEMGLYPTPCGGTPP